MDQNMVKQVALEQKLPEKQVEKSIFLIKEQGNTVPFVARYRKNETGNLSEDALRDIIDRWVYLENLYTRQTEIIETLTSREKLTPELEQAIKATETLQELEELYKPYKQKKKTRGMKAKERGLEPLSRQFVNNQIVREDQASEVISDFIDPDNGVADQDDALQGAKDIIAEQIAENMENRREARRLSHREIQIQVQAKDKSLDGQKVYQDYYDYQSNLYKLPPHRVMAINRGEKEGILKLNLASPEEKVIEKIAVKESSELEGYAIQVVEEAAADACKRLILPALERELRTTKTEQAEEQAINVFSQNLEKLLMQPPIKNQVIMGVDPAYKSGCKLAVVDETGDMKKVSVIYPTPPHNKTKEATQSILEMIEAYKVDVIAIGNGTASRETEQFVADAISQTDREVQYAIVSEDGASVYSASKLAQEEFPDLDVQERSAISIARRVLDPLAELVKIDPKSIGVGQYQHDLPQGRLKESVQFVVEKVVNQVGVDVNTASTHLLRYISGLNKKSAENMVATRVELGGFNKRKELTQVKGLGAKTFEQCAGFLRVLNGSDPLDKTPIHPESYSVAEKVLEVLGETKTNIGSEMLREKINELQANKTQLDHICRDYNTDMYTLKDILAAFKKPVYDPRDELDKPRLKQDVLQMEDLSEGMVLEGEVRNVVDFGAFVDLGIKQDGLIHISNLSDKYVSHPMEEVAVGDVIQVEIISLDQERGRIGLKRV